MVYGFTNFPRGTISTMLGRERTTDKRVVCIASGSRHAKQTSCFCAASSIPGKWPQHSEARVEALTQATAISLLFCSLLCFGGG